MHFDATYIILRLACGLVIGFAIGMTGIGGGVLVMPALTILLHLPASIAVGTASLYALLVKMYAVFEHHKIKTIDFRVSGLILAGAIPGNIIASVSVNWYVAHFRDNAATIASFQNTLKTIVAATLLLAIVAMVVQMIYGKKTSASKATGSALARRTTGIGAGFLIGGLIGLTSVGGGVLIIPLLMVVFGLQADRTIGSSIFIGVILVLISTLIYGGGRQLDYITAIVMFAGSIGGVFLGSRALVRMPEKATKTLVLVLMLTAIVAMMLDICGIMDSH